ncbi:unnamed protein product, partial [Brassica oleracea]
MIETVGKPHDTVTTIITSHFTAVNLFLLDMLHPTQ